MKIIDINNQERECEKVYLDPHWPGYVTVLFVSKNCPGYRHTEWMPLDQFFQNNPSLKGKILIDDIPVKPPPQIAGKVTKSTPLSLEDKTVNWKTNSYAGYYCWISRGTGEGQVRTILKNSATKLTLDKKWDQKPDQTSQYAVVQHKPQTPKNGNTLPEIDLQKLEEKARQIDLERGREPAPRQYTAKDPN